MRSTARAVPTMLSTREGRREGTSAEDESSRSSRRRAARRDAESRGARAHLAELRVAQRPEVGVEADGEVDRRLRRQRVVVGAHVAAELGRVGLVRDARGDVAGVARAGLRRRTGGGGGAGGGAGGGTGDGAGGTGALRALRELCDWLSTSGNTLTHLNLREAMRDDTSSDLHAEAVRLLCSALRSEHCALRELETHCALCAAPPPDSGPPWNRCGRCGVPSYCSRECQRMAWKRCELVRRAG